MYPIVPAMDLPPEFDNKLLFSIDMPKSQRKTEGAAVPLHIMFSGFMSRWIKPALCSKSTLSRICLNMHLNAF